MSQAAAASDARADHAARLIHAHAGLVQAAGSGWARRGPTAALAAASLIFVLRFVPPPNLAPAGATSVEVPIAPGDEMPRVWDVKPDQAQLAADAARAAAETDAPPSSHVASPPAPAAKTEPAVRPPAFELRPQRPAPEPPVAPAPAPAARATPEPSAALAEAPAAPAPSAERAIRVSLSGRRVEVSEAGVLVRSITNVSFGRPGHRTPTLAEGSLSLSRRIADYRSHAYAGAPMRHALFLEQLPSIAFHAGSTKAPSHGCIHLTPQDAAWLFQWAGRAPVKVEIAR